MDKIKQLYFRHFILKDKPKSEEGLIRIGSKYGGWTIPDNLLTPDSIVYSVGVGEDVSFDLALMELYDLEIYALDPTPRAKKYVQGLSKVDKAMEKFYFQGIGLWSSRTIMRFYAPENPDHVFHSIINLQNTNNYFEAECDRLKNIMQNNNHTEIDLLKLDIEGAEIEVLRSIIKDKLTIKVICVEIHPNLGFNEIAGIIHHLKEAGFILVKIFKWDFTFINSSFRS